jgi:hypothetical protein
MFDCPSDLPLRYMRVLGEVIVLNANLDRAKRPRDTCGTMGHVMLGPGVNGLKIIAEQFAICSVVWIAATAIVCALC